MKRHSLLFIFLITISAYAQQPAPEDDPIGRQLFPPDLVMAQSQKLRLTDTQRMAIKNEVQRAQSKFIDLQWEAKEAGEAMAELLQQTPIDEARVLAQADKVMTLEREIKKTQLSMLIRIKNSLSREQIAQLMQIRQPNH